MLYCERIKLLPDESGRFLWAEYPDNQGTTAKCGYCGGGGRILEYPQEEAAAAVRLKWQRGAKWPER